jgi:hypothetical protein
MAIFAFHAGLDMPQLALFLVFLILALFGIISWTRRAKTQYMAGAKLNALFSAALVMLMLALLIRAVLMPIQDLMARMPPQEVTTKAKIQTK